jgi:hypothetical protein
MEIIEQLDIDTLVNPEIRSKCITFPNKVNEINDRIILKKNLNLNSSVLESQLQFLADSHASLFINHYFVDEVFARISCSLWTEQRRVNILEVKNLFQMISNEIKIIMRNYKNRTASSNLIARVVT